MFGFGGRRDVVQDLHRLWDTYREIVSKQHHVRSELEKVYVLERREAELKAHLARIRSIADMQTATNEARRILQEEYHFVALIEQHAQRSRQRIDEQLSLISRVKRDLSRHR